MYNKEQELDNFYKKVAEQVGVKKIATDGKHSDNIDTTEVEIGNKVMSRYTGRIGKVIQIKADGETLLVKWSTGGTQLISKNNLVKLSVDKEHDFNKGDISNLKTDLPGYNKHDKKDIMIDTNKEVQKSELNNL